MKRITIKCNNEMGYGYKEYSSESSMAITRKLGQLEDVEEELEIELQDFIRILKYLEEVYVEDSDKPFYVKGVLDEIEPIYPVHMHMELRNKRLCEKYNMSGPDDIFYYFKDYGKTWALTKKELL